MNAAIVSNSHKDARKSSVRRRISTGSQERESTMSAKTDNTGIPADCKARSMKRFPLPKGESRGSQYKCGIDAMGSRLLQDPFARPRGLWNCSFDTDGAAGQREQRVVQPVANVAVGAEGQIHGPDEYGAEFFLEGSVEIRVIQRQRRPTSDARRSIRISRNAIV